MQAPPTLTCRTTVVLQELKVLQYSEFFRGYKFQRRQPAFTSLLHFEDWVEKQDPEQQ